jgi:hypothetical protein
MASAERRDPEIEPLRVSGPAAAEGYARPDDRMVLQAVSSLVRERNRPVWALEVTRRLIPKQGAGGPDGRWAAIVLARLAAQGEIDQVRRWKTGTSRWTMPAQEQPGVPRSTRLP